MPDPRSRRAFAASLLLHATVGIGVAVAARAAPVRATPRVELRDAWKGDTFDVDTLPDVSDEPLAVDQDLAALPPPDPDLYPKPAPPPEQLPPPALADPVPPAPEATVPHMEPTPAPLPDPLAGTAPPFDVDPGPGDAPLPKSWRRRAAQIHRERHPAPARDSSRPRHASTSRPAPQTPPVASAAAPVASGAAAGSPSYGQQDLPAGVRSLDTAFTRALPPATDHDAAWSELPLGAAGRVTVSIEIDAEGKLVSSVTSAAGAPKHLVVALDRVRSLLEKGRFSLRPDQLVAGKRTYRVSAHISQKQADANDWDDPHDIVAIGFDPAREDIVGRAHFTLRSGRHIELSVKIVE